MQSWMALLIAGTLIGPVAGSTVAYADTPAVSAQVETIVDVAYEQWHDSLGIRQACSSGVTIVFEPLDGRRGEYRTQTNEVVIDPTDASAGMDTIVVHELSHHTFLACGAFADAEFKAAFYEAQDLPEERDWFDYAKGWAATPAEHFAEAMAITVAGSGEGGISVGAATTAVVSRWLAGAPSVPPADSYEPVPYASAVAPAAQLVVDEGGGQPVPGPEPTIAEPEVVAEPTPALVAVDVYGETVQVKPVLVGWLNGWTVLGPL